MAMRIHQLISKLEDVEYTRKVYLASGPSIVRAIIKTFPEVDQLIEIGAPAAKMLVEKFREPPSRANDTALCCFAFVLERLKYLPAVPVLSEFLKKYDEKIINEHDLKVLFWSPHFVAHTLKVLTDQAERDDRYYTYYKALREKTVKLAKVWLEKRRERA